MLDAQDAHKQRQQVRDIDIDDLLDDPELERLHAERLATMQQEAEKRQKLQQRGHGEMQEISEGRLCPLRTATCTQLAVQSEQSSCR